MSAVLSRIFLWLFWLTAAWGLFKVFTEITQWEYSRGNYHIFSRGINIEARSLNMEGEWPDTTVLYNVYNNDSVCETVLQSGKTSLRYDETRRFLERIVKEAREKSRRVDLDTIVTSARVQNARGGFEGVVYTGNDSLPDGRILVNQTLGQNGKEQLLSSDTFLSAPEATMFTYTGNKINSTLFTKGSANYRATITMIPSGTKQKILYVIYECLSMGCFAMIFLTLYRLFRNFSRHEYFGLRNATHIRNFGILLIATELLKLTFYFICLHAKSLLVLAVNRKGEISSHTQYDFDSGFSMSNIVFGCGMLVLSYVFLEAWRLQQEQKFTI